MDKSTYKWLALAGAASGIVALITYLESRKKRKLQTEIATLDKQIKSLQLHGLQKGNIV